MSEQHIDAMPAETGESTLMQALTSQFERLHARVDALEAKRQAAPKASHLVKSAPAPAIAGDPIDILDPYAYLTTLLTTITGSPLPLSDLEIVAHRDECKNAILALRAGKVGATPDKTRDRIAYEAATRQVFIRVMAVLFDDARSRDPYAAQLQIS